MADPRPSTGAEVVRWMVALQAQDFIMARWAIGVRVPGATDAAVIRAVDRAALVRTHLLRPTWHLVAAEDVRWLLRLTAPQIKARAAYRDRQLELTGKLYARSNRLLERALRDGELPRRDLVAALREAGIPVDENRAAHLFMRAELDGVVCSGSVKKGAPTYALLDQRVPAAPAVPRDEALGMLAARYFASRGPATLADFSWWSGLSVRDAKRASEIAAGSLRELRMGEVSYLAADGPAARRPARGAAGVYLLPAYDEYVISYADRDAVLARVHVKKAISDNGIFRPTLVEDGQVAGLWTRHKDGEAITVRVTSFGRSAATRAGVEAAVRLLSAFWGARVELEYQAGGGGGERRAG